MECKNCGTTNHDNAKFCSGCGADLGLQNAGEGINMNPVQEPTTPVPPQGQNYDPNQNQNPGQNYYYDPNQNPNYGFNPNQNNVSEPGKGLAIAAMVCGIVSFFCFPIITGVLGIVFGIVAKNKGCRSGMATAGIVCGAIGLVLWIIMLIAGFSFTALFL